MGAVKRKRVSTDSAIADMSGEDSFSTTINTLTSDYNTQLTETETSPNSHRSKRHRSSSVIQSLGSNARDYGTAASQRPRRGAALQVQPSIATPQISRRRSQSRQKYAPHQSDAMTIPKAPVDESDTRLPAHEVNASNAEQTPQRSRAPAALPTPPQTIEKINTRATPEPSLRRSIRERRPTERSQQLAVEQVTPCRKISRSRPAQRQHNRGEEPKPTENLKTCIVRLRVPSTSQEHRSGQSMSITGSFSHRQKSIDDIESCGTQATQEQSQSFPDTGSFQIHETEHFAQPQSEPIPASSQELASSQLVQKNDPKTHTKAHLHEPEATGSITRERFSTSPWIVRQDYQRPSTPEEPPEPPEPSYQRLDDPSAHHKDSASDNKSWQTQPTIPWCPPWNAPSPGDAQPPLHSEDVSFHASQATTIDEDPVHLPRFDAGDQLNKQELHDVANRLLAHRTYGSPKSEPAGQPQVWADGRMELCETLHYFRAYQGASYCTGGFARGFMFDKVAHPRDYIDSNVVIARAGGGQVKDKDSGEMKAGRDQVEDSTSQSLRNCMSHYNPVVLITGVDNPHIQSQPPHQYCVLDHFKPTHIWFEKSGNSKLLRYRFEKLNALEDSWWRPKHIEDPFELGSLPPPFVKSCGTCARDSLQVYLNGWMCLQPTCGSFWLIFPSRSALPEFSQPYEPDETSLVYDPRFLKARTPWPNDDHSYPLTSNEAMLSSHGIPGEDTSETFTRGIVCPLCGRCNSRMSWTGWECANPTCDWKNSPPHTLIPAESLHDPFWPLTDSFTSSRDTHSPLVSVSVTFAHNYRINRYTIPGIDGFVTHMIANRTVNEEPGGPDAMFEELQKTDIGLRRRLIENSQLKGGIHTKHFLVNYGMPYKFIAATASHPFSSAARPITAALERLNCAASHLLSQPSPSVAPSTSPTRTPSASASQTPTPHHPFNEVLALAYLTNQKISYHDDGEHGLGPTIATLSLGAPGTMRLRLKAKHHHGVSAAGIYTDAPALPGSSAYGARLLAAPGLAALKSVDAKAYRARLKQLPKELGLRSAGQAREVLTLQLGHGDVVLMHGSGLQGFYEHAVEHRAGLRFALTCRWIDPASVGEGCVDGEGG